jgi:hypothetical protein
LTKGATTTMQRTSLKRKKLSRLYNGPSTLPSHCLVSRVCQRKTRSSRSFSRRVASASSRMLHHRHVINRSKVPLISPGQGRHTQ